MTNKLVGASVWEQDLYEHLVSHVENERGLLEAYNAASTDSGSPAFQYLVGLILEDEIRHHRRFKELASTLRTDAEFHREDPAIPRITTWGPHPEKIAELTEELLRQEREDHRELKRLAKELKDLKDTTLWQLLVHLMESDTEKHIQILEFVKDHVH